MDQICSPPFFLFYCGALQVSSYWAGQSFVTKNPTIFFGNNVTNNEYWELADALISDQRRTRIHVKCMLKYYLFYHDIINGYNSTNSHRNGPEMHVNTVATIVTCNFETINATILTSLRENKFLERANYTINQSARRTHSSRSIIKKGNKYFLRHFTMIIQN
jgi:hypothetical protein